MGRYLKEPIEKLETKVSKLTEDDAISRNENKLKVDNRILFEFDDSEIKYSKRRYYPSRVEYLIEDDFDVRIPLTHENLKILSSNPINPPNGARKVINLINDLSQDNYTSIILGADENSVENHTVKITKELYDSILKIDKEEGKDKKLRVINRTLPFFRSNYNIEVDEESIDRDYSVLIKEVIASGEITQNDLLVLSNELETGEINKVVIEKQVNRQVKWLIDTIESIIDEDNLTVKKAKDIGSEHFGFTKVSITGPEHLMETILSKYGQSTLFGVPALLNTDKYVIHSRGDSRSQFDIVLINHLGDVEVVELKRPDKHLLEYDQSRGKFYPSKDLSIAISQSERYISAVLHDNDHEYLIEGKTIRDYIIDHVGNTILEESIRPSALIIMGSWKVLTKDYNSLRNSTKEKVTRQQYNENGLRAYRELKHTFRNIKILTYSELLEHARTRLELTTVS